MNTKEEKKNDASLNGIDKKEMFLESPSGFVMPFPGDEEHDMPIILGYGEQIHPNTNQKFHHSGIDLACQNQPLFAMASGSVIGLGQDAVHGDYIVIRYGKFEVKYGHIIEAYVPYGASVTAGKQVAKSGDFLHFGVTFKGQEIDPMHLITVVYMNVVQLKAMGIKGNPQLVDYGIEAHTDYDNDAEQVVDLMQLYFAEYIQSLADGSYRPSPRVEQSLSNVLRSAAEKNYYFEEIPSVGNPLGLSQRSSPLVSKIVNLLTSDFLTYAAVRKNQYISSWNETQKKNLLIKFPPATC